FVDEVRMRFLRSSSLVSVLLAAACATGVDVGENPDLPVIDAGFPPHSSGGGVQATSTSGSGTGSNGSGGSASPDVGAGGVSVATGGGGGGTITAGSGGTSGGGPPSGDAAAPT